MNSDAINLQSIQNGITNATLDLMRFAMLPPGGLKPIKIIVHPERYEMLKQWLIDSGVTMSMLDPSIMSPLASVEIVQWAYIPLVTHERVRRWTPKPKRKQWYTPKKYRVVERQVLCWMMEENSTKMIVVK